MSFPCTLYVRVRLAGDGRCGDLGGGAPFVRCHTASQIGSGGDMVQRIKWRIDVVEEGG